MKSNGTTVVGILLFLCIFCTLSISAANKPSDKQKSNLQVDKIKVESVVDETESSTTSFKSTTPFLTYNQASSISPGQIVGNTWYDKQSNGTLGRMIDHSPHSGAVGETIVHFSWMRLEDPAFVDRHYAYNQYRTSDGMIGNMLAVQPETEYGGYVGLDVGADGLVVIGGHNNQGSGSQTHLYFEDFVSFPWWFYSRVPDSVASYPETFNQSVIWPKFRYQEGTDTVTHVIAQVSASSAADPQAIYYFRKVGAENSGNWDYPPYVIDTIYNLSHDIAASRTSDKVALVWTANLRYDQFGDMVPDGVCDTCSGTSPIHVQWDNDIYYQISNDQGQTWEPRVNVTLNRLGEAGFRPYADLSALIDTDDNLHILWSGVVWPADPADVGWGWNCRMFHWSENISFIRTVSDIGDFTQVICAPGSWTVNMSKMQISECEGKFYALWVQSNTAEQLDDCASRANGGAGDISGAVNGELYFSVSDNGGLTWDIPRNLTNSYTPDCEPGDCESDVYPSMARYGRQVSVGEDWSGAVIVDPSGSYTGDYFLDVQYINDNDPGAIVSNEGTWTLANVRWFRTACVEPLPNPTLVLTPTEITQPTWTKPSTQLDVEMVLENTGNVALSYSINIEENNGTTGWLSYSGLSGSVPSGISNIETGTLLLNNGGVQTTEIGLNGRLIFNSNAVSSPDTIEIYLIVADTVNAPVWDTLESACLALTVSNTGSYGNNGVGKANLDWVFSGVDCDTTADVYLYSGSPVILWDSSGTGDFTGAWSIYDNGWLSENGFRPLGGEQAGTAGGGAVFYHSGVFINQDSTLGVEKTWVTNTSPSDCDYVIQKLEVWSYDGASHNGLRIGEIVDWDIPSDSGNNNGSGFDVTRNIVYQYGAEYNAPDDTLECQNNDTRYGGIGFLKSELNGMIRYEAVPRAYVARSDSFIYPNGTVDPNQLDSMMSLSGFSYETELTDLHSVIVFEQNFDLGPTDTITFWTVLLSVENSTAADLQLVYDDAKAWAIARYYWGISCACCGIRGNVDYDLADQIDIADLVYFVSYAFDSGPPPDVFEEADVDASGTLDIADIVYLVEYMFSNGPAPLPCP